MIIITTILIYLLIFGLSITQYIIYDASILSIILVVIYGGLYFITDLKQIKKFNKERMLGILIAFTIPVLILSSRLDVDNWVDVILGPLFIVHLAFFGYKHKMIKIEKSNNA